MKMRQRIDALGLQLSRLTDTLRFTKNEQHGFALDYRLRLQLYEVAKGLEDLGYAYEPPPQISLDALIRRETKTSAAGGGVDAGDIINRVHSCLADHPPALRQVKASSGASDTLDVRSWDYLQAEIESYLFGPPLTNESKRP